MPTISSNWTNLRLRLVSVLVAFLMTVAGLSLAAPAAYASPDPISVTMTAAPSPVASGSSLTYTITTTNIEPQVSNVRLTDQLTGLKNVVLTSSRGYCAESNLLVTCDAGSMPGQNSTWTVTITGLVTAAEGTYLDNTATVTGSWSAQNTSQDYAVPATTRVLVGSGSPSPNTLADLSTSLTAPSTASPGASVGYTLTVNNSGGANATGVVAVATVPAGFDIVSAAGSSLFSCTIAVPTVTCRGGAVSAGGNATVTINATVSATTPASGEALTYNTTAVVDPDNAIPEANETNNTSSHTLSVTQSSPPSGQLSVTKTAASPVDPNGARVRPGDLLTYTVTVKNTGTSNAYRATRLMLTDGVQGLDAASVSATSSDAALICTVSATQVKCAAGNGNYTLSPGAEVVVTIKGKVVQPPSSIITNTATVQALQNKESITRTASVSTTVRPAVDLTVTTVATCTPAPAPTLLDCPPFRARSQFDYLVTVGNSGLNDATGVVVRIALADGVILEGFDNLTPSGGFTCTAGTGNAVTCSGGTVPGSLSSGQAQGTTRQLRLHLTAPNSTGSIVATTTVDPNNAIGESDETNNTFTTTTPIATGIDLVASQAARCPRDTRQAPLMCDPVAPSGTLVYDVLVQNLGSQDAADIKVTDVLPEGARFRSAKEVPNLFGTPYTPNHGVSCSASGLQVTCTGGRLSGTYAKSGAPPLAGHTPGAPDGFTIEITVFAPAPYGPNTSPSATGSPILNQVRVDPDAVIPEIGDGNNLNLLETNVGIPPQPGDWGTFNELTVSNRQSNPASGAVAPNGTLDYTLTVGNWGSDPVSDVTVYDDIPQGARFRDATAAALSGGSGGFACSFDAGRVTCAHGSLAASPGVGQATSTTITIRLFAPGTVDGATTHYTNHAVVDPGNDVAEANETNNVSGATLSVQLPPAGQNAFTDLTVTNQQTNPASGAVAPNGTLEYTLTVANSGSDPVSDVVVYDYVPQTARFRDVTAAPLSGGNGGFVCSFNAGLVSCAGGALAGGGSTKIKILLFAPNAPGDATTHYTNHAVVDPGSAIPEANEDNNASDAPLMVDVPPAGQNAYNDLIISDEQAIPASGAVAPSGTLIHRLTIGNVGSDPATNVVVRDYLPAGTTFRSAKYNATLSTSSTPFTCSQTASVVECANGSVKSGGAAVIDVTLFAPAQPGTINNQAAVDPADQIPEADESNNTAISADTSVALGGASTFIDLSVSKLDAAPSPVGTDTPVTYTLTVANAGSDQAFNTKVTDTLPQGSAFVSADDTAPNTSGAFTCSQSSGVVTCSGGSVAGGGSRTITIVAKSPKQSDVTLVGNQVRMTDSAQVDPDNAIPEGDETNNGASTTITVLATVDLTVTNDGSDCASNPSRAGGCSWSFGVTNNGPDAVSNVVVRTDLPAGATPSDVQAPDGWACQITSNPINQITCTNGGGTLAGSGPGASARFVVHVQISANNGDLLRGSTVVDPDDTIVETNEANNTASGTITIQANVDLTVTNDGSACAGKAGEFAGCIWSVSVTNSGTGDVSGVVVRTDFPVGVIPLDVQPPAGWTCQITENPINQVTCTVGSGTLAAGATVHFDLRAYVTANTGDQVTSSSIVDPGNLVVETDESNNTASSSAVA